MEQKDEAAIAAALERMFEGKDELREIVPSLACAIADAVAAGYDVAALLNQVELAITARDAAIEQAIRLAIDAALAEIVEDIQLALCRWKGK